ncbi:hypothetical protein P3X46_018989 [Hevea brasiliensis]|uniref:Thyroglobulin type-1 domain-containing protein n=2 Tax=Hevea brasiliensis TaxID=3981 RepID=A0ABQ9LSG1_HEVBR|nr:hypothetical protein P3X46_018989 [Hevea brasiliensis]
MVQPVTLENESPQRQHLERESLCEPVFEYFPACIDFLTSTKCEKPSFQCCVNVAELNLLAKEGIGPRWICWCIEYMVEGLKPPLNATRISELPIKCHTHLSFPISEGMDCDK